MKKVNILAVIGIILILIVLAIVFITFGNGKNEKNSILSAKNKAEVNEYIKSNKIELYGFESNHCYIDQINLLNSDSNMKIFFNENDETDQIVVDYTLFEYVNENISEEDIESTENETAYVLTNKDKEKIQKSFEKIKSAFEEYIGCEIKQYDLIPTYEGASTEDNDENFYSGNVIREYSVRDKAGALWLLRYEAANGGASATLMKIIDETEYEGFIPIVDMYNK